MHDCVGFFRTRHPRTFLAEYLSLVPAMMRQQSCIELLHCLLDLPSLTAAMIQTHGQTLAEFAQTATHPLAVALYNYILRPEVRAIILLFAILEKEMRLLDLARGACREGTTLPV